MEYRLRSLGFLECFAKQQSSGLMIVVLQNTPGNLKIAVYIP